MTDFKPGDRVRLKATDAKSYYAPYSRFALEGRLATISSITPDVR
jgi:hypothetical protein